MKRARKLLERTADRLDLPGEVITGQPHLELTGFTKLSVEHHRGVLEYTDETVTVALRDGQVRITGRNLSISLMNHEFVVVDGVLRNVALEPGDSHD